MKTNDSAALYANSISIPEENRVPGFDPLRFLKMTSVGPKLDLSTKKVWFRLKYPQGRIILSAQKMDQQLALIEARVFLNKSDTAPAFTSVVQRMLNEVPGGLYVQAAQNAAVEQVLDEAGFTVRYNGTPASSPKPISAVQNVPKTEKAPVSQQTVSVVNKSTAVKEVPTQKESEKQTVVQTPPAVEQSVNEQPVIQKQEPMAPPDVQASAPVEEIAPEIAIAETVAEPATEKAAVEDLKVEAPAEIVSDNLPVAETVSTPVLESIPIPTTEESAETASAEGTVPYTTSTPVEEICRLMSVEEALNYVITTGSCKGWTMAQAIARRPASVRFYTTPGYKGDDNILRASAAIVLKSLEESMAKAS